ncbi:MAG: tyrosine-type recombinase/integrase [Muribaculaceae bacterium]|nr:tyrosine-type recombinase/integrase [Muribaculaceae bacterium]
MSKKRQIFYRESTLRFHLRAPKSSRPTLIFLATCIDGKRYKISTKVRVYANQWDQERQLAVISNVQSKQDNRNNTIANNQLNKLRGYFSEFIEYICNNNVDDIAETLKKFINRDMAKKKINLVYVAADALEYYHNYVKPSIKDSTKRQSESLLSEFGRFVDTLREKDKTMQIFSQRGLNMYKEYLIDKMNKSKYDDNMRNFGVGQLNRCGSIIALLINKVLVPQEKAPSPVVWIKVDDPRREDQMGHIPLLDNEVAAIESCSGLTPVEEEYRDVFLLHLECGQRVSDLAKLLTGNYKVKQGKKYKYIVVSTTKENINAIIPITPKVTMLMDKIKNHKLVDPKEFEEKTKGKGNNTYNEAIRRIAKKAGLDREIVKIDSTQKEVMKPLYKTVSSHDARCTFITNMIRKGVSPERLCRMTGHANDEMIKRVYAQLTVEDEINRIESDLYSDVDEGGSPEDDMPSPIASSTALIDTTNNKIKSAQMSKIKSDKDSNKYNDFQEYVKGLEEIVDTGLAEADKAEAIQEYQKEVIDNYRIDDTSDNKSSSDIDDPVFEKKWFSDPNHQYAFLSMIPEAVKRILKETNIIDEDRRKYLNDMIASLEVVPAVRFIKNSSLIWKIDIFGRLFQKINLHRINNRPRLDDLTIDRLIKERLNCLPEWTIVHEELKKIPNKKLEVIIENTECPRDIKILLYNTIVSEDLNTFSNTIQSYEREAHLLIIYAYELDYYNNRFLNTIEKLRSRYPYGILAYSNEDLDDMQDSFMLQSPFLSSSSRVQEANYLVYQREQLFFLWFRMIDILKLFSDRAYSSEKRIFDRVINRMDQFPEFKRVHEEQIIQENSTTDVKMQVGLTSKIKPEVSFEELEVFKTGTTISELEPTELLSSLNRKIIERGDDTFKKFVNFLALSSCIDDDNKIKQLLVYRFTGKCRPKGDLEKIPWNPDKLRELAYVIMYSTERAKGKYEKVREFFEGPKFPDDISMIRTYADSAPQDFRLGLNNLYPDVFTIKGAR